MFKALARDFQGYKNIKYMLLALEILSSHGRTLLVTRSRKPIQTNFGQ